MSRIFFGNFDFEHELAAPKSAIYDRRSQPSRGGGLAAANRDWVWMSIAEADDVVLTETEISAADFAQLAKLGLPIPRFVQSLCETAHISGARLVPWGWTDGVRAIGQAQGLGYAGPPTEVVRRVNSRLFRYEQEREFDVGLAGTAIVSSLEDLNTVLLRLGNAPRGWLLKANFGMSGREARRGRGTRLDDNTRNWAKRRLLNGGPIVFEQLVERLAEAGIQMEIPQTGDPMLVGVTPLLVDGSGVYRGSRFATSVGHAAPWKLAMEQGLLLARRLQGLGYFGPLGVDAMKYYDDAGEIRLRPLQDLNARYTMGRLALGFRRILPPDWCGSWLHFGARNLAGCAIDIWYDKLQRSLPRESRAILTSPRKIGTQGPASHAVVVLAPTVEILARAESSVFALPMV